VEKIYQEIISEFIRCTAYPFTSKHIVGELGICYATVKKYLQELTSEGTVKMIGKDKGKNVYVFNKYKDSKSTNMSKHKHYTLESIQDIYRKQLNRRRELFDDFL
jgi:DNA-binding transcriptional regulator YhcF (GntR family)